MKTKISKSKSEGFIVQKLLPTVPELWNNWRKKPCRFCKRKVYFYSGFPLCHCEGARKEEERRKEVFERQGQK